MTHQVTFVEATTTIRDWLRTLTGLDGIAIYAAGLPSDADLPALAFTRQGGTIDGPVDAGLYRFDVWDTRASVAAQTCSTVMSLLASTGPTLMADGLWFMGSTPTSPAYLPDPDNEALQRYTFVAQVTTVLKSP